MKNPEFDIAILLPTRGRAESLERSIRSLVDNADDIERVQLMFGFDNDDEVGVQHFQDVVQPYLDKKKVEYTAMSFEPMGYIRLNEYVNALAKASDARWLVFWNDDAIMHSKHWDTSIMSYEGQFKLLAFDTHNKHPYSIFPIVPREWLDLLGYLSPHQISDAWLSQQAYLLDLMERTDISVEHDRFDFTGNNHDETFQNRPMLEGNPNNPLDFHSITQNTIRQNDCVRIANYLKETRDADMSFFENVLRGTQDPWEKLKINDVNRQMMQFVHPAHQKEKMSQYTLEDQIRDYWNRQPCNIKHGRSEVGTPAFFHEVSERRYRVEPHIPAFANFDTWRGKRVLEIGCGIATDGEEFARFGAEYVGIDYSDQSIELAKKRFDVLGLGGEFHNIDASNTQALTALGTFDMVYSFGVIHHFPAIDRIVDNVHAVLSPGGEFRFMVYAKHSWKYAMILKGLDQFEAQDDCPYAQAFSNEEIHQLLGEKFEVTDLKQAHCFMYNVEAYKEGRYELEPWFAAMTEQHRQAIREHLGWHLLVTAKKL